MSNRGAEEGRGKRMNNGYLETKETVQMIGRLKSKYDWFTRAVR